MNLIKFLKEYKSYKRRSGHRALISQKDKKKNIIRFIQLKQFEKEYSDILFKRFRIMRDLDDYQMLIDVFGLENLEKALQNEKLTTSEFANSLFESVDREQLNLKNSLILRRMDDSITFFKATGMELSKIKYGISPEFFKRKGLNYKNMISIFKENNVDRQTLQEIYEIYGDEIVSQYNQDVLLKNKSVLVSNGKYNIGSASGGLQDHVTEYTEEDFKEIFNKYVKNEEMTETEKYILMGLIAKESELIEMYSVEHLKNHQEYIKSEIDVGIFNDILTGQKQYTNDERKTIVKLHNIWTTVDLNRYNNLGLLKNRLSNLPQTEENLKRIKKVDGILSMPFDSIVANGEMVAKELEDIFLDYEIENRNDIIENVYNPENQDEIVITDLSQLGTGAMLHFFDINQNFSKFENYVEDLEEKRSKELGKEFHFSEKEDLLRQYEIKENHFVTDKSLDIDVIGQVSVFDDRYVTNTSNQLSAMILTPKEILRNSRTRGVLALGFSKKTLSPELIATTSNENIHSNKGIDYVESYNEFRDFSASYQELTSGSSMENTEVVMFRNSFQSSLKPSYVMYIAQNNLEEEMEKQNINFIKNEMEKVGLKVPLVIFDRYSIIEKMNKDKEQEVEHEL